MDMPAFAGTVTLRYARPEASATAAPAASPGVVGPCIVRRNQLTIAAVMFVLGILVVVQLQTQASGALFAGLSSQDLTVLVANLNDRNDQLRREVANLERDLGTLSQNTQRGDASIDELRADLRRVRALRGDRSRPPGPA